MNTRIDIPEGKRNNRIFGLGIIESFWVSVWLGRFKFNHTALVRLDEVSKAILVGNLWLLEQTLVVLFVGLDKLKVLDFLRRCQVGF